MVTATKKVKAAYRFLALGSALTILTNGLGFVKVSACFRDLLWQVIVCSVILIVKLTFEYVARSLNVMYLIITKLQIMEGWSDHVLRSTLCARNVVISVLDNNQGETSALNNCLGGVHFSLFGD